MDSLELLIKEMQDKIKHFQENQNNLSEEEIKSLCDETMKLISLATTGLSDFQSTFPLPEEKKINKNE